MSAEITAEDHNLALRLRVALMEAETPEEGDAAEEAISAALAAERAKAREPFLALARHWERKESTDPIAIVVATLAANEIRRAAEES